VCAGSVALMMAAWLRRSSRTASSSVRTLAMWLGLGMGLRATSLIAWRGWINEFKPTRNRGVAKY
jgi:hypothetical protein